MGQLKFEKDFRGKLNRREIDPESGSWEELSARLNTDERGKSTAIWWIGIAASLVGGILISSLLFIKPISESPEIVNAPAEEIFEEEMEPRQSSQQKPASEEVAELQKASVKPLENIFSKKEPSSISTLASIGNPQETSNKGNDQTQEDPGLSLGTGTMEIPKDGIAQALSKQEKTGGITDSEVEVLLAAAVAKISAERSAKYVSESIDPKLLLLEAQRELELSFRENVFELLKQGYFKAKTAVVNRN